MLLKVRALLFRSIRTRTRATLLLADSSMRITSFTLISPERALMLWRPTLRVIWRTITGDLWLNWRRPWKSINSFYLLFVLLVFPFSFVLICKHDDFPVANDSCSSVFDSPIAFSFNNQKNNSDKEYSFSYSIPPTFLFYTMEDSPIVQYIIMRKVRTQEKRNIIELCFIGSYEW